MEIGRITVQPHLAVVEHRTESFAVRGDGCIEHVAHRGAFELRPTRARGFPGDGEQAESGHVRSVVAGQHNSGATLHRVPSAAEHRDLPGDTHEHTSGHPHGVTRLLTVRHGESEWNAIGRWQGQADPPLTDAGMLQAAAAARVLGAFDAVWASSLQRASLTAEIIAEQLGIGPVQLHPGLMENAFGPWEGLTVAEIEHGWPGYLIDNRRPDGAEQPEEVTTRGLAALREIAEQHCGGEVLVITHAGLIRTLRRALDGSDLRFNNLGGCWFHVHDGGRIVAGDPVELVHPQTFGDTL